VASYSFKPWARAARQGGTPRPGHHPNRATRAAQRHFARQTSPVLSRWKPAARCGVFGHPRRFSINHGAAETPACTSARQQCFQEMGDAREVAQRGSGTTPLLTGSRRTRLDDNPIRTLSVETSTKKVGAPSQFPPGPGRPATQPPPGAGPAYGWRLFTSVEHSCPFSSGVYTCRGDAPSYRAAAPG